MSGLPEIDLHQLEKQSVGYDYLRFTWSDFHGIARGKTVPARHAASTMQEGIGCLAGIVAFGPRTEISMGKRVVESNHCNGYSKPASDKIVPLPWAGGDKFKIGEVICETTWLDDGKVQDACPRYLARKQLKVLESMGLELMSACEQEFLLCKDNKPLFQGTDYCTHLRFSDVEDLMLEIDDQMTKCGIDADTLEVEYSPGQVEMAFKPAYGIQAADNMFRFKNGVKEMLKKKGIMAVFMSKPFQNKEAACGTHFNHSLWTTADRKNAFYDASRPDNLSVLARHWIGGVLTHMPALTALCCPTANCYRRLHTPWAPDKINWDYDNRLVTWRVKNSSEKSTYMENRMPSGASNIYIVMAATIAAGVDGINRKLEPLENGKLAEAKDLPHTLAEALDALEKDVQLSHALGEEFIEWFLLEKRSVEVKKFGSHDVKAAIEEEFELEREEYLEMI